MKIKRALTSNEVINFELYWKKYPNLTWKVAIKRFLKLKGSTK
jgi:hypothetical protein